jgi:hypothetical protein
LLGWLLWSRKLCQLLKLLSQLCKLFFILSNLKCQLCFLVYVMITLLLTLSEIIIDKEFIYEGILQLLNFFKKCLRCWLWVFDHSISLQSLFLSFEKMIKGRGLIEVILLVYVLFRSVIPLVCFLLNLIEKLGHKLLIWRFILRSLIDSI